MEQIILEGSPLADYLRENDILEDVIPIPSSPSLIASLTGSSFSQRLRLEEYLAKWWHSTWKFLTKPPLLLIKCKKQPSFMVFLFSITCALLLRFCFSFKSFTSFVVITSFTKRECLFAGILILMTLMLLIRLTSLICLFSGGSAGNFSWSIVPPSKEMILNQWHQLSLKLLQRWNYLRELDELHQSFCLNTTSFPDSFSLKHDKCTHMLLRHELYEAIQPLLLHILNAIPGSTSITDSELRSWLMQPTPPCLKLKDLKYLILELRERLPRCSTSTLRQCEPHFHNLRRSCTLPTSLPLPNTTLSHTLYRLHVMAMALDEGLPWTYFEKEWAQLLHAVQRRRSSHASSRPKKVSLTNVETPLPTPSPPPRLRPPRKVKGSVHRKESEIVSTEPGSMSMLVDELKLVLLTRNATVSV